MWLCSGSLKGSSTEEVLALVRWITICPFYSASSSMREGFRYCAWYFQSFGNCLHINYIFASKMEYFTLLAFNKVNLDACQVWFSWSPSNPCQLGNWTWLVNSLLCILCWERMEKCSAPQTSSLSSHLEQILEWKETRSYLNICLCT